ncbi:hypothetical protein FOA52_010307 [Chlamydomonas sp. UWO 241]|nr:hypothetical protein FOA52_010307 [Chlamydomonas sp. UWO 241]
MTMLRGGCAAISQDALRLELLQSAGGCGGGPPPLPPRALFSLPGEPDAEAAAASGEGTRDALAAAIRERERADSKISASVGLTAQQADALAALAGCSDVLFREDCLRQDALDAVTGVYAIPREAASMWFCAHAHDGWRWQQLALVTLQALGMAGQLEGGFAPQAGDGSGGGMDGGGGAGDEESRTLVLTTLVGDGTPISQDRFLQVLRTPAAAARLPEQLFEFYRPRMQLGGRASSLVQLTESQHDLLYALAACRDVAYRLSRVKPEVRAYLSTDWGIDVFNISTWCVFLGAGYADARL